MVLSSATVAAEESDAVENKQALATSPEVLVDMLEDISFMTPEDYREKLESERNAHAFPIGLEQLPQHLDATTDPRRRITAEQLEVYAGVLTDIARESKRDGEILWGRIQGTKYERQDISGFSISCNHLALTMCIWTNFPQGQLPLM